MKHFTDYYYPLIEEYNAPEPFIHIDKYASRNGITRFQETIPGWKYSKDETVQDMSIFTHLISTNSVIDGFDLIDGTNSFDTITGFNYKEFRFIRTIAVYVH